MLSIVRIRESPLSRRRGGTRIYGGANERAVSRLVNHDAPILFASNPELKDGGSQLAALENSDSETLQL